MVWLATASGLFCGIDDHWQPAPGGQPLMQPRALLAHGRAIFAGGEQGRIVFSEDRGQSWYESRVGQTTALITSMATSPAGASAPTLLAGTASDGVLRSTDGGRSWQLANAGLRDFDVHALALAPDWPQPELALAGTGNRVYRSYNGGRAWKATGLSGVAALGLALAADGIAFAATEAHGLFRSDDGGRAWQALGDLAHDDPINAICLLPGRPGSSGLVLGTGAGRILQSADGGQRWEQLAQAAGPVLCVQAAGGRLIAGGGGGVMLVG